MEIRFFKVQGVDASTGQMRLKVWVRMTWKLGERLVWAAKVTTAMRPGVI